MPILGQFYVKMPLRNLYTLLVAQLDEFSVVQQPDHPINRVTLDKMEI